MTRRVVTTVVCDRCKRVAEQHQNDDLPPEAPAEVEIHLRAGDPLTVTFQDMCPACRSSVQNLIKRIALVEEPAPTNDAPGPGLAPASPRRGGRKSGTASTVTAASSEEGSSAATASTPAEVAPNNGASTEAAGSTPATAPTGESVKMDSPATADLPLDPFGALPGEGSTAQGVQFPDGGEQPF